MTDPTTPRARDLSDRFAHPAPGDWFAELFADADVIQTYSRAQAIADGALIDVSDTAKEAGFRYPVAMTAAAWAEAVRWDDDAEKRKPTGTGQDESGRLWDVLWVAKWSVAAAKTGGHGNLDRLHFRVLRVPTAGRGVRPRYCELVVVVGPGDLDEPVITILLPHED